MFDPSTNTAKLDAINERVTQLTVELSSLKRQLERLPTWNYFERRRVSKRFDDAYRRWYAAILEQDRVFNETFPNYRRAGEES